jgi:hypothetical protein
MKLIKKLAKEIFIMHQISLNILTENTKVHNIQNAAYKREKVIFL